MKDTSDYFDAITQCMMVFQYIEESLKMALIRHETLILYRLKGFSHYSLKPKISSIRNAAMGRLIDMLSVFCDSSDDDLIKDLRKIKKWRDAVAHKGLLMTIDELNNEKHIHEKTIEMEEQHKEAESIMSKVGKRWADLDKTLNELKKSNNH